MLLASGGACRAAEPVAEEFRPRRAETFAFAVPPSVSRRGDRYEIRFETTAACDATVVIEDESGRIVRHLASGVLGRTAPPPLVSGTNSQLLVWDGKDDLGEYVRDPGACRVRVSLGLKPTFEKPLLWSPHRRMHQQATLFQAAPEGVYVYDGRVLDHVRLFDHEGRYVRTIYPFPADRLEAVVGLHRRPAPQSGALLPRMEGFHHATLLSAGRNGGFDEKLGIGVDRHNNYHGSVWGQAATALAVRGTRVALAQFRLNRLATDGSTGGLPLGGPDTTFPSEPPRRASRELPEPVAPTSAAFDAEGKTLYLTGYVKAHGTPASRDIVLINSYAWLPVVARVPFEPQEGADPDAKPEVFVGSPLPLPTNGANGSAPPVDAPQMPTSVTVDETGRVLVSDFARDRLLVYAPDRRLLKTIPVPKPAQVALHRRTGKLFVFSFWLPFGDDFRDTGKVKPTLTVLRSVDEPTVESTTPLPLGTAGARGQGVSFRAEVDSWCDPPVVWLSPEWGRTDILTFKGVGRSEAQRGSLKLYRFADGKFEELRDFEAEAKSAVARAEWPEYSRQRLHADPATGALYVAEGQAAVGKSTLDVLRIDPESGRTEIVPLPFDAEDLCFDPRGHVYLRTFYHVVRFDPRTWREVPFDYGEEVDVVRTTSSALVRKTGAVGALRLPVKDAGLHHHGGMGVSVRGHLVVAVNNSTRTEENRTRKDSYDAPVPGAGKPYEPPAFPGRARYGEVHVWDRHGQMLHEDAVPGVTVLDGVQIDRSDDLYLLSASTRVLEGRRLEDDMTGTLVKVSPRKAKLAGDVDRAAVPLAPEQIPPRAPDLQGGFFGRGWFEGAHWFFGGTGFAGKNAPRSGGGCNCWNARFALDYLGRSFAPEMGHFSIAVLDSAGNLVTRIGRYGNADSAGPGSQVPLGGDEVALFYAPYVAVHTERRLFVADPGNARLVSIRLDHHATARISLRDVPDAAAIPATAPTGRTAP